MKKLSLGSLLLSLLLAGLPLVWAADNLDAAGSSITAVFTQMGVPVDAKFKKFTAQIDFDPANPAAAKAQVEVDVSSFDIGDPEYNKEVLKKEWFNAAQFPKAIFVSTAIKSVGTDKLQCAGQLTIKGKTLPVNVTLTVKQQGSGRVFEGSLPIKRLDFNIGEGDWKSTDMLADVVTIKFKAAITATTTIVK
jgi:polyisoprenoid-binding protein YceI